MSVPGPACPPVASPWWWTPDSLEGPAHPCPTGPAVIRRSDRGCAVRCGPHTTAPGVRGLDVTALADAESVVLDLDGLPEDDAAVARAVAALRVRLLVRGLRVELRDAPPSVLTAIGGSADVRYRVVDGPRPGAG